MFSPVLFAKLWPLQHPCGHRIILSNASCLLPISQINGETSRKSKVTPTLAFLSTITKYWLVKLFATTGLLVFLLFMINTFLKWSQNHLAIGQKNMINIKLNVLLLKKMTNVSQGSLVACKNNYNQASSLLKHFLNWENTKSQ